MLAFPSALKQRVGMLYLSIAGIAVAVAASASAESLRPTGRWVVDYHESQCLAVRQYGSSDKPLHLMIKPSPTSNVVQIALAKSGGDAAGFQTDASLRLGEGQPAKVKLLNYGTDKKSIKMVNLNEELAASLAKAKTIELVGKGLPLTRLDIGPIGELMKVLANCRDDLRAYYNIDEARRAALRSRAKPRKSLVSLFRTDDYPDQAVAQDESGITSVVLLVDDKGAVADCMIDETSGIATLDAMTCIVVRKNAKFDPAIGTDGKPTRDSFTTRVRWEMRG